MSNWHYCHLCRASTRDNVLSVPKDANKRQRWSESAGVKFDVRNRICVKHFKDSDFGQSTQKRRRLIADAVPQKLETESTVHKPERDFDFNSQTEQHVIFSGIALENLNLKTKVSQLKKENDKLHKMVHEKHILVDSLRNIFTESQIRKLQNGGKRIQWTQEDISSAVGLHTAGPRAYQYLIKKGFPLPGISTIDKWLQTVDIKPGILDFAIDFMLNADIDDDDKICILKFDEMRLTSSECSQDYVLVVMAQGLRMSWKQPIYFDFGKAMSVPILHMLIQKLYTIGYPVVAIVSDMGPGNQKLWSNLEVSPELPWFEHPSDSAMKVFVFADAPNLLKLIRNHFLDSGLVVDGKTLTQETVRQAMNHASSSDFSTSWKVKEKHLNVRFSLKHETSLATELLSNSTASGIRRCSQLGLEINNNAAETADFIQLANDWFDIFNVKSTTLNSMPTKSAFGQRVDAQQPILERMTEILSKKVIPNGRRCYPFQKGILVSNASLYQLYLYVVDRYNMDSLITSRLSLDQLQHFFIIMRDNGGAHVRPTPSEFKLRLRKYLLGNSDLKLEETEDVDLSCVKIELGELAAEDDNSSEVCYPTNRTTDELTPGIVLSELYTQESWELAEESIDIGCVKIENHDETEDDEPSSSTMTVNKEYARERKKINEPMPSKLSTESVAKKNQFQCSLCPKDFSSSSLLITHILTHTAEQPVSSLSQCLNSITQNKGLTIVRSGLKPPKTELQVDKD